MKRITILFFLVLAVGVASAQVVPQTVNFSAVLRDSVGNIMPDTDVSLRLMLREGGANGSSVYTTQTTTATNDNGYVSVMLNRGMSSYGTSFTQIPWENGDFWIQVDYKTDGMSDYRTQGCYELTSNFYSFVAGKANRLEGIDFYVENLENGDALVYNSETGRFEARALTPPRAPALSTVLEVGNDAGGMNISNLAAPVAQNDIVTKEYADSVYHRIMVAVANINRTHNGHEYVDLGLPSGTMWAKCNVGAATPEGVGGYYAWGEISTKTNYTQDTYTYMGELGDSLPADADVASVFWGGGWHIPTFEEMNELRYWCAWKFVQQNGRYGYKVTGPNGCSIFLPGNGYKYGTQFFYNNSDIYYRTCSANWILYGRSSSSLIMGRRTVSFLNHYLGCAIRPVFSPNNNN